MSMNIQRITISLPNYLYNNLVEQTPFGQISSFVAKAIEKRLMEIETNPIEKFIVLREKLPKKERAQILKAIKKGRL